MTIEPGAGEIEFPQVSVHDLARRDLRGSSLLDVRTRHEYAEGHVPGAQSLPLHVLVGDETEVLSAGMVFVICGSGPRSAHAAEHLRANGVEAVLVRGGTQAWVDAGYPLEVARDGPA